MTARDELRGTLSNTICNASNYAERAWPYLLGSDMSKVLDKTADAILAAGYREHRIIATVGELVALEDPATILMDYCGHPYQWGEGIGGDEGWMAPHDPTPITSHHLWRFIPLTVLYEPEPQP